MPVQSVDEREAAATEGSADQLAEDTMDVSDADLPTKTRDRRGASAGMHLDQAAPDHAPSERSGSDSTASTSKRENKSAFVKIMKLGRRKCSWHIWRRSSASPTEHSIASPRPRSLMGVVLANRPLHLFQFFGQSGDYSIELFATGRTFDVLTLKCN